MKPLRAVPQHQERGEDARDLLSLRRRLDELDENRLTESNDAIAARERDEAAKAATKEAADAAEREALAIDDAARQLEAENRERLIRLLTIDAIAGLASYFVVSVLRSARSEESA